MDKTTFDVTDKVAGFDIGALIEIDGNYKFNKRFLLFASFAYQRVLRV
jgi:hypothetical protein